jgi:O-antigen ligase
MSLLPYRISLAVLLLAITLPFLGAHHYLPVATFYQEWLAGILGLAALIPLATVRDARPWLIPRASLLPLTLTMLAWVQFATGSKVMFETTLLLSLYLVWAFMLMLALCRIESALGRQAIADTLAWGLLVGALLVATTGALQRWAPSIGMPYIFPNNGTISGNIAQPNNFADYLWIGITAALYLYQRGKIVRLPLAGALTVLIGFSLVSGSRSVYFYGAALTLWLAFWGIRQEGIQRKRLIGAALLLLPGLYAIQWLITFYGTPVYSAQRLVALGSYDPVRPTLWRAALQIFSEHPILGAGFDSFSREFFERIESFPINGVGIPEHSHNLFTEMLAEFGLLGFGLVLSTAVLWLWSLRKQKNDPATFLAVGAMLILGIHSGLEYPLWYGHFLAIATMMLALGDGSRWQVEAAPRHRMALAAMALIGGTALINLRADYNALEVASQGRAVDGTLIPVETQQAWLLDTYSHSLLRYYAALQFAARMPLEASDTANRLKVMKEALDFSPIRQGVFRYAALLQLDGQHDAAMTQLQRAMQSYPGDIPMVIKQMEDAEIPELTPLTARLRQRSF